MDKLILTCAVTGSATVPTQSPYIPISPEQIAADALACAELGASAIHIHARDPKNGKPSADPRLMKQIAQTIKAKSEVIVGISTGGGIGMTPAERLEPARICEPELASFNLGTMNFSLHTAARHFAQEDYLYDWEEEHLKGSKRFIFRNTFEDMELFAQTMKAKNIKPEFEAYDLGHLHNLKFLEKTGFAEPPYWIQFVLGVLGGLSASPESLVMMVQTANQLFGKEHYRFSVIGVGYPMQFRLAATALAMGGHVRVGLEDNIFIRRGQLASNSQMVEKVLRLAQELERELASPSEARALLGLKGLSAVAY